MKHVLALEVLGVCLGHYQGVLVPFEDLGLVNLFSNVNVREAIVRKIIDFL